MSNSPNLSTIHSYQVKTFKNNKIGIFVSFECKQVGKLDIFDDRRRAQEIVGNEIKNAGGIWFAIDDSDVVEAIKKTMKGEM